MEWLHDVGWLSSLFNMAGRFCRFAGGAEPEPVALAWNDRRLMWAVREPFRSKHSSADLVAGLLDEDDELVVGSQMPQHGVIFSDGVKDDGHCPFANWFERLGDQAAAKVASAIERMRSGNFGDHKSVGAGVMERRVHHGPGFRIDFGRDGAKLVILLGGGTKSRQSSGIKNAKHAWAEYKATRN